jgi:hypothetical protein
LAAEAMIMGEFHLQKNQIGLLEDGEFYSLAGAARFVRDARAEKLAEELERVLKRLPLIRLG